MTSDEEKRGSEQRQIMLSALELVFAGGTYVPPEILAVESFSLAP